MVARRLSDPDLARLGVGRDVMASLCALVSRAHITYLEQISRRPGSVRGLQQRPWAAVAHHRILASLMRAGWVEERSGVIRLSATTLECVTAHVSDLLVRGDALSVLSVIMGRRPPPTASAPRVDARESLACLATPHRWAIVVALARRSQTNVDLAAQFQMPHSLVSYHVRRLEETGLVSSCDRRLLCVERSTLVEMMDFLRSLSIGWPYRPSFLSETHQDRLGSRRDWIEDKSRIAPE